MATFASNTMLNYFTKLPSKAIIVEETNPRKLAPVYNKQHVEEFQCHRLQQFDEQLLHNVEKVPRITNGRQSPMNYIESIKSGQYKPYRFQRRRKGAFRAKLLQYHEDVRPPYFGTWQRKSLIITGRRPFKLDEDIFEYDVDSEAEWDIGGPGESLKGDDSEDDEELDDYEIDMQTFVPHGYVSDDEMEGNSDHEENAETKNQKSNKNHQTNQNATNSSKNPQQQTPIVLGICYNLSNPILKTFQGFACSG